MSPNSSSSCRRLRGALDLRPEFRDLLENLFHDWPGIGPVEADARRAPLNLCRAQQRRQGQGDAIEDAFRHPRLTRAGLPLAGLVFLPGLALRRGRGNLGVPEDMRVAAQHLVGDRRGNIIEGEELGFLGHPGMKDDLEQQVAELVLQRRLVPARNRIGDLVGFFDRVGCNRREILHAIPGTAALGIAQLSHDCE